jgi:septal ring factor EnvC (AmiA/AmiB activator)
MQIEVQMKETRKLHVESKKRSMELATELGRVKAENERLHELLLKAERERDRIRNNYRELELHVTEFASICMFSFLCLFLCFLFLKT